MDQQTPIPSTSTTTSAAATQSPEPQPPPQPPHSAPAQLTTTTTTSSTPQPLPSAAPPTTTTTPNPNPKPTPAQRSSAAKQTKEPRQWLNPQPPAHFQHFSSSSPSPSPSLSGPSLASTTSPASQQRGGVAIGVPASHAGPTTTAFSSSFGQFGVLGRSSVNMPESVSNSSNLQARQGIGMVGSGSSSSQIRPSGISLHHPQRPVQSVRPAASSPTSQTPTNQRPVQSSVRPAASSPTSQTPTTQTFQGHGFIRPSSVGPPVSSAQSTPQMHSHNQQWRSSGPQAKPPLPSPQPYRSITPPSMHQRSHMPQQHHPLSTTSQQQQMPSVQPQQNLPSHQPQEHFGQQFPPSRTSQSSPHQQQVTRVQSSTSQKMPSPTPVQPPVLTATQNRTANAESDEYGNRILSKRSIQELVSQIDPSERLDPEVEDILADIADNFVESITTFGCSLAKHRKSDTLEAKDILLHLERNWNMTLPGFSGDEIKSYRKPATNDIHKERLAAIRKSVLATEMANAKSSLGQTAGNAKGNLTKTAANAMVPPNMKTREVT